MSGDIPFFAARAELSLEPQLNATLIPAHLRGGMAPEAAAPSAAAAAASEPSEASTSNSGPV